MSAATIVGRRIQLRSAPRLARDSLVAKLRAVPRYRGEAVAAARPRTQGFAEAHRYLKEFCCRAKPVCLIVRRNRKLRFFSHVWMADSCCAPDPDSCRGAWRAGATGQKPSPQTQPTSSATLPASAFSTVTMRANRPSSTSSVRALIASGLHCRPRRSVIGKVSVASVT